MNRARVFTGVVGFALVVLVITALIAIRSPSLSPAEAQLVGRWTQRSMPADSPASALVFTSQRTFYCEEGEIEGRWWIENGQLFFQQWTDEKSQVPMMDFLKSLRAEVDGLQCTFHPDANTVELALPGEQPLALLARDEDW